MATHELPAHLRGAALPDFTDYAADGIGSALPPHVSIRGNTFTPIDAGGAEYPSMPVMDVVIVDRSNVACKRYYDKPYIQGQETGEPPACWSTNGVGPSRDAATPQARTCAECDKNVRGSAVSKVSGASIKACRDEYYMAILPTAIPGMLFQFVLTPGSFKNWQAYVAKFKDTNLRISMVVTRMSFVPKVNGEIQFQSVSYADEPTYALVSKALKEKATDALVGRLDQPRPALAAPAAQAQIAQQVQQPDPLLPAQTAQPAVPTATGAASATQPASSSAPAPAQRRRRRTAAEMQAANGSAPNGQAIQQPAAAPQAPFPHAGQSTAQPAGQAAAQPANFGIAQPAEADPALGAMLDDFFKG
jgi:hypothetical protein